MPSNTDFSLNILVGDTVLPEYEKDGIVYVESNFFTPFSFKQTSEDNVNGETEIQSWPVTPFSISVEAKVNSKACYYRFYVDGQKVSSKSVRPGTKRTLKGFRDGTLVREFLFSLPRFARNEYDRIDDNLSSKVGVIEVECCNATLKTTQQRLRTKSLQYDQANKKDCNRVTDGNYLMSTTKAGRVVGMKNSYRNVDFWYVHSVSSRLSVKYVTAQTIQEMDLTIIPIQFPPTATKRTFSRPNILKKRSNNANNNSCNSATVSKPTIVDNENHVTGSVDHEYTVATPAVKEEVVHSSLISGETIDLTLDGDDDEVKITG